MSDYEIDRNAHYFILMSPLEGIDFVYKTNIPRKKWVECEVLDPVNYFEKDYKVRLSSLEEGYGSETYYIEDFISLLEQGYIIKNDKDYECVEVKWNEPLTPTVHVEHKAYTLKPRK